MSWNKNELRRQDWGVDLGRDTQQLAKALEDGGFKVVAKESDDSSGWGAWPIRAGEMLKALFPKEGASGS